MLICRKIYYELMTGNVIQDTGERSGSVVETTTEQDFATYKSLTERVPETVGVIELAFGELREDFRICTGFRIDPATEEILFSYPDPSNPNQEPVYQKPLSIVVQEQQEQIDMIQGALDFLIMNP